MVWHLTSSLEIVEDGLIEGFEFKLGMVGCIGFVLFHEKKQE